MTTGSPQYVGIIPVRQDIPVLPRPPEDNLGTKEWAEHGNCAVYTLNHGILDGSWNLVVGGTVLIRSQKGGWYMTGLKKNSKGWYVHCADETVWIVWSMERS